MNKQTDNMLLNIAQQTLGIETLETRKSDSLDFHDVAVWCIKDALAAAFQAGSDNAAGKSKPGNAQKPFRRRKQRTGTPVLHIQNCAIAIHRNGICGTPFHAILFEDQGPEGSRKLAILFEQPGHCAVLDIAKLADGDISFGSNSWRGDKFEPLLRAAINESWIR